MDIIKLVDDIQECAGHAGRLRDIPYFRESYLLMLEELDKNMLLLAKVEYLTEA